HSVVVSSWPTNSLKASTLSRTSGDMGISCRAGLPTSSTFTLVFAHNRLVGSGTWLETKSESEEAKKEHGLRRCARDPKLNLRDFALQQAIHGSSPARMVGGVPLCLTWLT